MFSFPERLEKKWKNFYQTTKDKEKYGVRFMFLITCF